MASTDKRPDERLQELIAEGIRMSLVYEDGAYWQIGFVVGAEGKLVRCFRSRVEWLLPKD